MIDFVLKKGVHIKLWSINPSGTGLFNDESLSGWLFPGPQTPPLLAVSVGLLLALCIDQVK